MQRILLSGMLCAWVCLAAQATGDSLRYLTPKDTVFLTIDGLGDKFFDHKVERGQTLFSLAKFYGLSLAELYLYNPDLKEKSVTVGLGVQIPIPSRAIIRFKHKGFSEKEHVPVYYVVKSGDTMYRISKTYFRMEMDTILRRNQLTSESIRVGQTLHIGWMSISGIPPEYREGSSAERGDRALETLYTREKGHAKEQEHSGMAVWQKESKMDYELYALHRTAKLNSIIQVYNPMTKATIYAQVLGRIPESAYNDNVILVLSPMAAKKLGAIDAQLFVKVKYY